MKSIMSKMGLNYRLFIGETHYFNTASPLDYSSF
jgi:hypothetical protein